MIKVFIKNPKLRTFEYQVIKNLEKKKILFNLKNKIENVKYDYEFNDNDCELIFCLRKIFDNLSLKKKMFILKDLYKNMDCVIFGGGPTSFELSIDEIKKLKNKYFLFAVKYIIILLKENNINPDFSISNMWLNNSKVSLMQLLKLSEDNISAFGIDPYNYEKYSIYNDIICSALIKKSSHKNTFNEINKGNINVIDIKYNNDNVVYNLGHCMLELVIPFAIYLGFKNIYTFGWDLSGKNTNDIGSLLDYDNIKNFKLPTEKCCLEKLNEGLIKKGIHIYKCNEKSAIQFPYKNILN